MVGSRAFAAWRRRQHLSLADAADLIGVHRCSVWDFERGRRRPSLDNAVIIERLTGGAVPVSSWTRAA